MKQHITIEQLNELNDKQKKELEDWTFEHIIMTQKKFIPLLSIGQMIEFLGIDYYHAIAEYGGIDWVEPDKMCDELWEAVKEVLDT